MMGDDRQHRRQMSRPQAPHMQIGHAVIGVGFDGAANRFVQPGDGSASSSTRPVLPSKIQAQFKILRRRQSHQRIKPRPSPEDRPAVKAVAAISEVTSSAENMHIDGAKVVIADDGRGLLGALIVIVIVIVIDA